METVQDDIDHELLPLFLEEAGELLPQIGETLQVWCAHPDDGQLARKLLRSLHTLKGSARMAGAMRLGEQIHLMEDRMETAGAGHTLAFREGLQNHLAHIGGMLEQLRSGFAPGASAATEEDAAQRVAFASISKRLYRTVRQTCRALDKKANLELRGTEIELDRNVLEKITAPLEHLLRNAIAHGLEPPGQRERAGKPPVGEISLSLRREPEEMIFEFSDDGAGLDIEALRRKAAELGLPVEATVGDERAMRLIFEPGLSTAREVTETTGRGVGMDVVRSEIAELGGRIEVTSGKGMGTRFTIHLPLLPGAVSSGE
jgi:chemotaxis protein histidine kinase CheA